MAAPTQSWLRLMKLAREAAEAYAAMRTPEADALPVGDPQLTMLSARYARARRAFETECTAAGGFEASRAHNHLQATIGHIKADRAGARYGRAS